ncbi:MAG: peptide chain release factor N(5)-glutamine methyltransferase [Acidobacteriota bacterium]
MSTLGELQRKGAYVLKDLERPSLEAKIILLKTLGISEEKFFSEPKLEVSKEKKDKYFRRLDQRKKGRPLAYITGSKEFWSLDFKVGQGVLIPRPETEVLVEKALPLYSGKKGMVVDVGTGCGNVAVALAKERPELETVGLDISAQAVDYARKNALVHDVQNVWFAVGDLFEPLKKYVMKKQGQIIVSNPPYVDEKDWGALDPQIRDYEPKQALVSGQEGYAFIKRLIRQAPDYLMPGGYLIFEIGKGQEDKVKSFFTTRWESVQCVEDLAGIKRVFLAKLID